MRRGFTLMELLIVILIIGLLASLSVAALMGAAEQSREARTKAIVAKLDQLIGAKWDSYQTRRLPISTSALSPQIAAAVRLNGLRDLQRMELPDRLSDVEDWPADLDPRPGYRLYMSQPSLHRQYQRKAAASGWTIGFQGSECLYLIVSTMRDGDKNAIDFFSPSEIGDVDGDGMNEILDGWGRPIVFIRWPVGYVRENGAVTDQTADATLAPDRLDVLRLDRDSSGSHRAFAVRPLIASSGRDHEFDILSDNVLPATPHEYSPSSAPMTADNNAPQPFAPFTDGYCGTPMDRDGDGILSWLDNITNHWQDP